MYQLSREQSLNNIRWDGTRSQQLDYIDTWRYENLDVSGEDNFRSGFLRDWQLSKWLGLKAEFEAPAPRKDAGKLMGGIRLLLIERADIRPYLSISRDTFERVETAFHLHPGTTQALFQNEGVYFHTFTGNPEDGHMERFQVVIKVAQKADIANYLLSMSYEFATGLTTALLIGYGATTNSDYYNLLESFADDTTLVSVKAQQSTQIRAMINAAVLSWDHPMTLPILVLQNHAARSNAFRASLGLSVLQIEHSVGVAFPYHEGNLGLPTFDTHTREELYGFTTSIHATMVQIMYVIHVYDWASGCCEFMLKLHKDIVGHLPPPSFARLERRSAELRETIEHVTASTKCLKHSTETLRDRANSQLQIVYVLTAQYDAQISSKIAISTGRDSTAMKTLAGITAIFSPLNFVASLFSMSMFTWQSTDSSPPRSAIFVSSYFWVYWVVATPLTILVLWLWREWWKFETKQIQKDLAPVSDHKGEKSGTGGDRFQFGLHRGLRKGR